MSATSQTSNKSLKAPLKKPLAAAGGTGAGPTKPAAPATTAGGDAFIRKNPPKETIQSLLLATAQKYDIPPAILMGIAEVESNWCQYKKNGRILRGGCRADQGIMQINEDAHPEAFPRARYDIAYNIEFGARYLRDLHQQYQDWPKAIAAYNLGSYRVNKRGHVVNQVYIDKVHRCALHYDPQAELMFTKPAPKHHATPR